MKTSEASMLIVGGGPAGLTASLLLSRRGVRHLLIDKHTTDTPLPRARGVHARAVEILRECGVEADMRRAELPITPGAEWRSTLAGPKLQDSMVGGDDVSAPPTSPCDGVAVSQDVFESVLRGHAVRHEVADVRRGVELERLDVLGDGVEARVFDRASGARSRVRARYVIAADGARSRIRQQLDIGMEGSDDLGVQRMVAFRADLRRWVGERPRGIYLFTETGAVLLWTHPDDRWVINAPGAAGDGDDAALVRRVLSLPELDLQVLSANSWTAAAQSATEYSRGPVFLVGDAAHRFPPAGATGVSAAMHDVHNLAWKLAAVLDGWADPALLDTYAVERQAVGRRNATDTGAAWARTFLANGEPFAGRSLEQIDMGYQYRSAAVVPDGSADADPPGSSYVPSATPGVRAPHLWLDDARRSSTLDLFGHGLTLLTAEPAGAWRSTASEVARSLGIPLSVHTIEVASWPQLYGITATGAVLVRPDGHVAWRASSLPADSAAVTESIRAALATATGRATTTVGRS